jgi:hypothetical protein
MPPRPIWRSTRYWPSRRFEKALGRLGREQHGQFGFERGVFGAPAFEQRGPFGRGLLEGLVKERAQPVPTFRRHTLLSA